MVIVDSSVWIDYLADRKTTQTIWLGQATEDAVGLTDLAMTEVLQGIRGDAAFESVRRQLLALEVIPAGGIDLAVASARNYRALRAKGVTVRKTIDCLIATFCILEGHVLLHSDRDFDPFEQHLGLRVVRP